MKFRFNIIYFLLAVVLFLIEIYIALYVHDRIIRPFGGDFLVVILIYCAIRAITDLSINKVAIFTLLFSYGIEIGQYFDLVRMLGLEKNNLARVVIGTSFAWDDIWAYTLGILFVLFAEWLFRRKNNVNFY